MAILVFTISSDLRFHKTVGDDAAQAELELFKTEQAPYAGEWIEVDDGEWIRRTAIVSARELELEGRLA